MATPELKSFASITFCWLPPLSEETGEWTLGVRILSFSRYSSPIEETFFQEITPRRETLLSEE